eukprot:scaffold1248_cov170-Amphora_coffeaeformis.AAC.12
MATSGSSSANQFNPKKHSTLYGNTSRVERCSHGGGDDVSFLSHVVDSSSIRDPFSWLDMVPHAFALRNVGMKFLNYYS